MKNIQYTMMPTAAQWKKDSNVAFAFRSQDRVLTHVDWLLERLAARNGNVSMQMVIVADIFFTANSWVKLFHKKDPNVKAERYPAIMGLFECAVKMLCNWLGCKQTELLQQLCTMFGSELSSGGNDIDNLQHRARYLNRQEREFYRLHFKGGMAYQYPWWDLGAHKVHVGQFGRLRLADSIHAYAKNVGRMNQLPSVNFGCYVCTMEREFFMMKHSGGEKERMDGIYHSAYTAGMPVLGAGSMLIEKGVVKAIRDDSGHYQPKASNMICVIQALGMYGVPLGKVQLLSWDQEKPLGTALDFIKSNLSWSDFVARRDEQLPLHRMMFPLVTSGQAAPVAAKGNGNELYFNT